MFTLVIVVNRKCPALSYVVACFVHGLYSSNVYLPPLIPTLMVTGDLVNDYPPISSVKLHCFIPDIGLGKANAITSARDLNCDTQATSLKLLNSITSSNLVILPSVLKYNGS